MNTIKFLTVEQVQVIHHRMIAEFGGHASIMDPGLLASAVMMPAARFNGEYLHNSIPAMAAAYLFHLCKNHAFADGNKRTALVSTLIFLSLNDITLTASDDALEALAIGVADGSISKSEVVDFFNQRANK
jgi:death-on-curing protein